MVAGTKAAHVAGPSRRTVLAAMAAVGLAPLLAGCPMSSAPSRTSHPALSNPGGHGSAVMLRARSAGGELRSAVRELARRARGTRATVLGLGPGVFDGLGLASARPRQLTTMESFPGDVAVPEQNHADVLLQVSGSDAGRAARALDAMLDGLDVFEQTWSCSLLREGNELVQGRALNRNVFGFTEGLANPSVTDDADQVALVGPDAAEPRWFAGGSYLAARVLAVSHTLWDAEDAALQELAIGRRADGTWLDGTRASEEPDFAGDPHGAVTPLDSHVRLVNPRDGSPAPAMLRRSWTYAEQPGAGRGDGLLFMGFQADLDAGFRRAQQRLGADRLARYALPTGGGYFAVPPPTEWEAALLG